MPKYKPTYEDMYKINPCPICGRDIIFDDAETCSYGCQQRLEIFKKDFEWFLMRDLLKNDDFD